MDNVTKLVTNTKLCTSNLWSICHLYEIKADIFVKRIQDERRQAIMTPGSVNQQQLFQKPKLKHTTAAYYTIAENTSATDLLLLITKRNINYRTYII